MINIKKLVENSILFLKDMYPESNTFEDILLEEAEISDDRNFCFITIGFNRPRKPDMLSNLMSMNSDKRFSREYKIFKLDTNSGEVISMKIRKNESSIA